MKTFNLIARITIGIFTSVEAKTLEEAIEIANQRQIESANNWNIEEQASEAWVSSDFDGEPTDIHEE